MKKGPHDYLNIDPRPDLQPEQFPKAGETACGKSANLKDRNFENERPTFAKKPRDPYHEKIWQL